MTDEDVEALARHLAEKSNLNPDVDAFPFVEPMRTLAGAVTIVSPWAKLPAPAWFLFVPIATDILQFLERRKA